MHTHRASVCSSLGSEKHVRVCWMNKESDKEIRDQI